MRFEQSVQCGKTVQGGRKRHLTRNKLENREGRIVLYIPLERAVALVGMDQDFKELLIFGLEIAKKKTGLAKSPLFFAFCRWKYNFSNLFFEPETPYQKPNYCKKNKKKLKKKYFERGYKVYIVTIFSIFATLLLLIITFLMT